MLIKSRKASDLAESQVTPEAIYLDRRQWLQKAGLIAAGAAFGSVAAPIVGPSDVLAATGADKITMPMIDGVVPGPFGTTEPKTPYKHVTTYNNFYEFGTDKADPAYGAVDFVVKPWSVAIEGEVARPGVYALEDLINPHQLEERIYRMRCVEAWSMVIPWVGISLGDLIARLEPTSKAKYVAFETLHDPDQMPGQRRAVLQWPYREGLRIDEATHPLTILAVGLYGSELPNQNGAPLRLVVPWKYGFKGIKSIVRIRFVEEMPETAWNISAPREYGFYANVNPQVDHPRWSQARERRIGDFFRRDTHMFNGYGEEVAGLYKGMDLAKNF